MREPFDPLPAVRVLAEHEVRFVIIGGFAGNLRGSPIATWDLDICYAREAGNYRAMARALLAVHAKLRGVPPDVAFILDARTIAMGDRFTFTTDFGPIDILGAPDGTDGFDELNSNADEMDLGGVTVRVAALDDLIRMKLAARRPKDLIHAEILGALRDETEGQP